MEGERKPLLMYFTGKTLKTQTFCSISDTSKSYSTWNPELRYSNILTVQHGWFLCQNIISKYVTALFLWNPYNHNKIILPPLQHNGTLFRDCILSSSPSANHQTCSIYLFSSHSPSIFYYQLGDQQWIKVCFFNGFVRRLTLEDSAHFVPYFDNPVYCNGCVYAGYHSSIVVIEKLQLNAFTINYTRHIMMKQQPTNFQQVISRLIGSNNLLFRIEIFHVLGRVTLVLVFKFDCSEQVWEKVQSIKDKVFFISSLDSAFACQAINPETEGGRIYIALEDFNFVYIYNIEDNCLITYSHFSNLSENRSYSRWFIPDTRMDATFKEQIRENKRTCDVVYLKDEADIAHNDSLLPQDVVEEIAKHINDVFSYLHFRASNKLLRLAAPPIQWRSSSSPSMSRFDDHSTCPLFVFSKNNVFTFVNPKHGLEYKYLINFPQDRRRSLNSEICCSKDGWLLLVAIHDFLECQVFYNPFTKQVIPLSFKHKPIRHIRCFGMSHSPTSYECVVVELKEISSLPPMTKAHVNLIGNKISSDFTFEDWKFPFYNVSPTFHNGLFYFLSITGKLGVVKVTRENTSWKELEEPQAPCSNYFNNFLVECDANLLSVFEGPLTKGGVQVFKLNESTMTWIKVESLKNHMLFVGKTSFSAVASIPGMENKVYFPRFYGQNLVFYSLETNNYHTFQHDEVVDFHNVKEHLKGTWIQPRWH